MQRFIVRHEILLGLLICTFSLAWIIALRGYYDGWTAAPLGLSWLGFILILDNLDRRFFSRSLIISPSTRKRKLAVIILVALLWCVILDGFGVFTLRLWYYPHFSITTYLALAPLMYVVYTVLLFILYEFVKNAVYRHAPSRKSTPVSRRSYTHIIQTELLLGIIGYALSISYAVYLSILGSRAAISDFRWLILFASLVSTFFLFEYISFRQTKETFTYDILKRNFSPLLAIMGANILAIIAIEFANSPLQIWIFNHWPLDDVRIFGVPLIALLGWPLQFPVFLSMLRATLPTREAVW